MVYVENPRRDKYGCSEVDPTGSLWYKHVNELCGDHGVLKLTLPGHYGIGVRRAVFLDC